MTAHQKRKRLPQASTQATINNRNNDESEKNERRGSERKRYTTAASSSTSSCSGNIDLTPSSCLSSDISSSPPAVVVDGKTEAEVLRASWQRVQEAGPDEGTESVAGTEEAGTMIL